MSPTINTVSDNPYVPGMTSEAYVPDQLIAGDLKLVTANGSIPQGQKLKRGTVLAYQADGTLLPAVKSGPPPSAILADDVDTTLAATTCAGVYLMGEFNAGKVIIDASLTVTDVALPLRTYGIFLKTCVSANDPTDPPTP